MLLANPHLPWSDLCLWYEAQMTAPGFDAYGAALVDIPVLAIAKLLSSRELTLFRNDPKIWTPLSMGAGLAIAP